MLTWSRDTDAQIACYEPNTDFAGPVGQQAKAEGAKTRDEFADLANSKQIPEQKTATGQNLTREWL